MKKYFIFMLIVCLALFSLTSCKSEPEKKLTEDEIDQIIFDVTSSVSAAIKNPDATVSLGGSEDGALMTATFTNTVIKVVPENYGDVDYQHLLGAVLNGTVTEDEKAGTATCDVTIKGKDGKTYEFVFEAKDEEEVKVKINGQVYTIKKSRLF